MKKINIRSKIINIYNIFINASPLKKFFVIAVLIAVILVIGLLTILAMNNNNHKIMQKEIVTPSTKSKISVSTNSLLIKEWNLEMPINGDVLGTVSYSISDDDTKLHFISSKLNTTDLSSTLCKEYGITKESWGIVRSSKKSEYNQNDYPFIIGDFEYRRNFPPDVCSNVGKIDAAFNYAFIHLTEKQK